VFTRFSISSTTFLTLILEYLRVKLSREIEGLKERPELQILPVTGSFIIDVGYNDINNNTILK